MKTAISRRTLLQTLGIVSGFGLLGAPTINARAQTTASNPATKAWYELGLMADPIMDNQLLHFLAATYSAQADIGEVLETAQRIKADDVWSWANEWIRTATRVRTMGDQSLTKGHKISAGKAYLRAANYYRAALIHHPEPKDPSVLQTGKNAVKTYDKAIELLKIPAKAVRIPYENTTLPGYFFRSPHAKSQAPTLIFFQGRDAWPEESKYIIDDALERGYHCLIFHGPGQGMAIREQGLAFRPDWEKVINPVINFTSRIVGVDSQRLAVMGISMGGVLAPRAAAFEPRIKVLIANPGVLNWGQAMFDQFNNYFPEVMALLEPNPQGFDMAMAQIMQAVPLYNWYIKDSVNKHGASSPSDLMFKLKTFNNESVVSKIRAHTLVMDGTAEGFSVGQAKLLFDALKCPKDYMLFTAEDTGLQHVQEGAQAIANHRMFDWLDEYL
jgi:esterase/lipase